MAGYIKEPHTAIFIGQTGCGKTHLVLELIENQYITNTSTMSLSYVERFNGIRHIIPGTGSKQMIRFGS